MEGLHIGDAREFAAQLPPQSVQTIVTSPPYFGLRSYLAADDPNKALELGSEATPAEFVANLVALFAALRPALRDDGTLWLNLGDCYATANSGNSAHDPYRNTTLGGGLGNARAAKTASQKRTIDHGLPEKNLLGMPWRVAFALQSNGWILRSDVIWHKPNPMPESVRDRPTRSHEYLFLLTKQSRYFYDADAIAEVATCDRLRGPALHGDLVSTNGNGGLARRESGGTRNKRSVWTIPTVGFPGSHYATMPPELVRPCILAGSRPGDLVCDPFLGSGTTAAVAIEEGRRWVGCDLDERNVALVTGRTDGRQVRMGVTA